MLLPRAVRMLAAFSVLILLTACQQRKEPHAFYVSNSGNDHADGLSRESAWRTLERLNRCVLIPGDSILLEAGGTWRETLYIRHSGTTGRPLVFSRYGQGTNPRILGSELCLEWRPSGLPGVWKSAERVKDPYRGRYDAELFFVDRQGKIFWGFRKRDGDNPEDLKDEFDWTHRRGHLYIYSGSDPGKCFSAIENPERKSCIRLRKWRPAGDIEISGIDLFFSRSMGFDGGWSGTRAENLVFRHMHVGWIGVKGGDASYGLSVAHSGLLVDSCEINDCGRRGISYNLYSPKILDITPAGWLLEKLAELNIPPRNRIHRNIVVRNSRFRNGQHTTSLDLAAMPGCRRSVITDVWFYNNLIEEDSNLVVGAGNNHTSNQLFIQAGGAQINNIYIYNNLFKDATGRHILTEGGDTVYVWNNTIYGFNQNGIPPPYASASFNFTRWVDLRNNIFYLDLPPEIEDHGVLMFFRESSYLHKDYNLYYQKFPEKNFTGGYHGYFNASAWKNYLQTCPDFDQHSPEPCDPLFEMHDFQFALSKFSVARGAGERIEQIDRDLYNNPVTYPPSLGAVQNKGE